MRHTLLLVTLFTQALLAADASGTPIDFSELASECQCKLGVAAQWLERPEYKVVSSSALFPTASTYKLPIAAAFLSLVDSGTYALHQPVELITGDIVPGVSQVAKTHPQGGMLPASELIRLMIVVSDNSASDAILRLTGGPKVVTGWLHKQGIEGINVAAPERAMSGSAEFLSNSTTPEAMVELLGKLERGKLLKPDSTAFLLHTMEETTTYPGRVKGLLPAGTVVGHKTGTGETRDGVAWATNDVALITVPGGRGHIAIAVYMQDSRLSDGDRRDRVIAKATRLVWDAWTK